MERFLKLNYFERVSFGILIVLQFLFFVETFVTYKGCSSSPFIPSYAAPLGYLINGLQLAREAFIFGGIGLVWLKRRIGWIIGIAGLLFNLLFYTFIFADSGTIAFNLLLLASLLFSVVCLAVLLTPSVRHQLRVNVPVFIISASLLVVLLLLHFYTFDIAIFIGMHFY